MRLHITPGSLFARMIRVLVRELDIACDEVAITDFPPPAAYFEVNPLGQVPALETEGGVLFPTRLIIDHVLELPRHAPTPLARAVRRAPDRWQDEQTLAVLLAVGDALGASKYQRWAGLGPVGENLVGHDPAERHMQRVMMSLDWLEARAAPAGFMPGFLSAQDIALACVILWAEARGGIDWRGRPALEAIVATCAARPSFLATAPQPWP